MPVTRSIQPVRVKGPEATSNGYDIEPSVGQLSYLRYV